MRECGGVWQVRLRCEAVTSQVEGKAGVLQLTVSHLTVCYLPETPLLLLANTLLP